NEFGFVNPILVGADGLIIAGHARTLAARQLGLTDVPVIVLDHLTPTQRRALVIADNRLALNAGWDEEMLQLELSALRDEEFDLELLGFEDSELDVLLLSDQPDGQEDIIPDLPEEPVSRTGDLWLCGPHRVLCGDSTSQEAVSRLLGERKPLLMVTDPPYGIELDPEWRDRAGLNSCGAAEPSYLKRTEGHRNTSISSDTRADWS